MAVAFQTSSSLAPGTRTNSTLTAPSGIADGDLLVLILSVGGSSGPTATPPSGFAAVTNFPMVYSQSDPWTVRVYCWTKVASSESGNYTATHSSASTEGFIMRLTGQAGTPINPNPVKTEDSNATPSETTITAPTITPAVNDSMVVAIYGSWNQIGPSSAPSGTTPTFTERYDGGAGGVLYVATGVLATAGATGSKDLTSPTFHQAWAAGLVVVEADTGGGGGTPPIRSHSIPLAVLAM